ncbi:MAG: glutamate synthase subunit beta [Myxococcales bacterium]|nr:glutamate synthase subunit beta [Myxococcales bacterium]
MGRTGAFLEEPRREPDKEPAAERVAHSREFERRLPVLAAREQGARCMNCGVPTCHGGCPLGNAIPDFNDLVYRDRWKQASASLHGTNNFPEVTGRVCPAPCEAACVLELSGEPVTIRALERAVADRAIDEGWLLPQPAERRTGRRVAVVGSGPAGLACAQELARMGHDVTVLERSDRLGGLLRYGIPDFKLDKSLIDRRIEQMRAEGVSFRSNVDVGRAVTVASLRATHDAVVLATGATIARDLPIEGRALRGVHFAMEYLEQANRAVAGDALSARIDARDKRVLILGGGDTGSDCLGTALRQGAASIVQLEIAPRAPDHRGERDPWPHWPWIFRTSSSQEEGGQREFAVRTVRFIGDASGNVTAAQCVRTHADGDASIEFGADLVLLAMGFTGPEPSAWSGTALATDARGNIEAPWGAFSTSEARVFACGDARRGQSLVVWAIAEGRACAEAVHRAMLHETESAAV